MCGGLGISPPNQFASAAGGRRRTRRGSGDDVAVSSDCSYIGDLAVIVASSSRCEVDWTVWAVFVLPDIRVNVRHPGCSFY
jgi:hypothetical protein